MEAVTDFIFLGSKVTVDGESRDKIKRHLLLGRKSYDKPRQHIKKQRHHFADKVYVVIVYPVVMYGCESLVIRKVECQRIDGSELWCWRRLLRVPWTGRSNQSILK